MSLRCLSLEATIARQQAGALLIDVRTDAERALGMAKGAAGITRETLEHAPEQFIRDQGTEVLLICASGHRSELCARVLMALGYSCVAAVSGGIQAWAAAGLPMTQPTLDGDLLDRYSRQMRLPEVGLEGQAKLGAARVLIVGAGGLGSPAALYLAGAGVGRLRIVDDDVVDRSNLQRQILHADTRIGMPKVDSATLAISAINPRVRVEAVHERVTARNVESLLEGVDVVLDGGDNFAVRYLLNDACVKLAKPLVYGAVQRFEGQVSVFDAGRQRGVLPCYRCLYPEPPPRDAVPNCAEAGVLGVLPGVIGMLQTTEAVKLILDIGEPLCGRLLRFDALTMQFQQLRMTPDPACPMCAPGRMVENACNETGGTSGAAS